MRYLAVIVLGLLVLLSGAAYAGWIPGFPVMQPGKPAVTTESTSAPSTVNWISSPQKGSSGEALLMAGKILLKNIYTYKQGAPDYLPESYSGEKTGQNAYLIHSNVSTSVVWPAAGNSQVTWESSPKGSPLGWSGTVVIAGPVTVNGSPSPVVVKTDCSGLITSLFSYANTQHQTAFTGWKVNSLIPEAGCFNPQGARNKPNPLNYYNLFVSGQNDWFKSVPLSDLQPGDIIAYANTNNRKDSGHVMLVAAVSNGTMNSMSRQVVVIDETGSVHSSDTRHVSVLPSGQKTGAGIGMGYIRLAALPNGTLQFYWGLTSPGPEIGSVALGRAL
ncbi:MAG TPA: hypothetical protein VMC42_00560 [Methanoregulaceae archaeon]|nr:hypothetical protein [Methanoregulaceae archaeon]